MYCRIYEYAFVSADSIFKKINDTQLIALFNNLVEATVEKEYFEFCFYLEQIALLHLQNNS